MEVASSLLRTLKEAAYGPDHIALACGLGKIMMFYWPRWAVGTMLGGSPNGALTLPPYWSAFRIFLLSKMHWTLVGDDFQARADVPSPKGAASAIGTSFQVAKPVPI